MNAFFRWLLSATALLLFAAGCTRTDWPPTAPVSGTVTFLGKPVPNADLGFQSVGAPRYGYGTTDAAGRYTLSTLEPGDGGIIGEHIVIITAGRVPLDQPDILTLDMNDPKNDEAYKKAVQAGGRPPKNPAVPARYGSPNTSPLRATVKPGANVIDFDLSEN